MASTSEPEHQGIHLPKGIKWAPVDFSPEPLPKPIDPPLGVLKYFKGTFAGTGFNTIFRPDSRATPTPFPKPVTAPPEGPVAVLEANLTTEELSFTKPLGSVPNRGSEDQPDIFLNGVSYLQTVTDVTNVNTGLGDNPNPDIVHVETGFWMDVPASTVNPKVGNTLNRMGSIPHGTTINAQGGPATAEPVEGKPNIGPREITPFALSGNEKIFEKKQSQNASDDETARLPQDLSPFIKEGTITQETLNNPAQLLNKINDQIDIKSTITINITTHGFQPLSGPNNPSPAPSEGGNTANIAFLVGGKSLPERPNANVIEMDATFWIESVRAQITLEPDPNIVWPILVKPDFKPTPGTPPPPLPTFSVNPLSPITAPKTITVHYMQIQYAQIVFLKFHGTVWPHVSVATLVPKDPIEVPAFSFDDPA